MAKKQVNSSPEVEMQEVVTEEPKALLKGTVTDCFKLNIRKKPTLNSDVVSVVNLNASLDINESKSTMDWWFVADEDGNSGYCMKQYVKIN